MKTKSVSLVKRSDKPNVSMVLDEFLLDRKTKKEKIIWSTFSLEVDVTDCYITSIHCVVKAKRKKKKK